MDVPLFEILIAPAPSKFIDKPSCEYAAYEPNVCVLPPKPNQTLCVPWSLYNPNNRYPAADVFCHFINGAPVPYAVNIPFVVSSFKLELPPGFE